MCQISLIVPVFYQSYHLDIILYIVIPLRICRRYNVSVHGAFVVVECTQISTYYSN